VGINRLITIPLFVFQESVEEQDADEGESRGSRDASWLMELQKAQAEHYPKSHGSL
jgi:hypothetical protein